MSIHVNILSVLVQRLKRLQRPPVTLYGLRGTDCITILTFIIRKEDEDFENVLPAGVEALGELTASREDLSLDFPLGAIKEEDGTLSFLLLESDDWVVVKPTVIDNAQLATLRVRAKLPIQLSVKNEETDSLLSKLDDKLNSDAAAYLLEGSRVITICNGNQSIIHGAPQDISVEELACYIVPDDEEDGGKPSKRVTDKTRPLDFQLYWSSVLAGLEGVPQCAPLIYQQKRTNDMVCLTLPFDSVAVIPWSDSAEEVAPILSTAITRQLKLFVEDLKEQLKVVKNIEDVIVPEIVHFLPDCLNHYITLTYPKKTDEMLEKYRQVIHSRFDLPLDRPLFRRGNVHHFAGSEPQSRQLINPHSGLNLSGSDVALVQGRYAYHHYMQDNFDDNGWGCAYRSLQTICSWFRLQGYTERAIPSHEEIQRCLVAIGDKPSNFIGSRLWIGSMEVSFCLQKLLGVDCNIVHVSSGAEMTCKARQIIDHFRSHGTPIMIGGGVLAHTIIGIDYNEQSGDARYLILDPHYTGAEDLRSIRSGGWCQWKPNSFWKANSFYNMCMPLRPIAY